MYRAAIAALLLVGCSAPANKTLPPPPLPPDIAMRLGSWEEIHDEGLAFKAIWRRESRDAPIVAGMINDDRHLEYVWLVVSTLPSPNADGPGSFDRVRVTIGRVGVTDVYLLSRCQSVSDQLSELRTEPLADHRGRREKTSVIMTPNYVVITSGRERHFRQQGNPALATAVDNLMSSIRTCLVGARPSSRTFWHYR